MRSAMLLCACEIAKTYIKLPHHFCLFRLIDIDLGGCNLKVYLGRLRGVVKFLPVD